MIIVVMGVTASGKTTVGQLLAQELGWFFYDADDFHPQANIDKMKAATPLTDEDRQPWLEILNDLLLDTVQHNEHCVLACSALKEDYRELLSNGINDLFFVHLIADIEVLKKRAKTRTHPFMSPELVESQLALLEDPPDALTLDTKETPAQLVASIRKHFQMG